MITNNIFPGTSINLSTNLINVGFGQKILANVGILNTVVGGGWNRLLAGSSTVIQMGTKMNFTWANSVNVNFGNSWNYFDTNHTMRLVDLKYAVNELSISAGMNPTQQQLIAAYNKQQTAVVISILAMFAFTFGMAIVFTAYPPFDRNTDESNQFNQDGTYLLSGEILSVIAIFLVQFVYAKLKSENNLLDKLSTKLSLSAKGLSTIVYDDNHAATTRPNLVKANDANNRLGYDYYIPGTAGFSMLGMLPGMPDVKENNNLHWRNPKSGFYLHDKNPAITLYSRETPPTMVTRNSKVVGYDSYLNSSAIDLLPNSIMIAAEKENYENAENFGQVTENPDIQSRASIYLDPKESGQLSISCLDNKGYGSIIALGENQTLISQHIQTINNQSFINLEVTNTETLELTEPVTIYSGSDTHNDVDPESEETNYQTIQSNSGIKLSSNNAQLYTNYKDTLLFSTNISILKTTRLEESATSTAADKTDPTIIFTCKNTVISEFTDNISKIGDCVFTARGSDIGCYLTTRPAKKEIFPLDNMQLVPEGFYLKESMNSSHVTTEFSFDPNRSQFDIREQFNSSVNYLPRRQSKPESRSNIQQKVNERALLIKQHVMAIQGITPANVEFEE